MRIKNIPYNERKLIVRSAANNFFETNDLFYLAEVYINARRILLSNKFPIKEYENYTNTTK